MKNKKIMKKIMKNIWVKIIFTLMKIRVIMKISKNSKGGFYLILLLKFNRLNKKSIDKVKTLMK